MGQENEKLIVKINPESTYALDWVVAHIRGAAYDNVYSLRCGDFYLARLGATEDDPSGHNVGLSADLNDNSYWRIVGYSNIAGETVYYLFDMNEVNALTFTMDYDWNVDGFICDSYGQDMMSLGSQYRFFFDRAQPQDWTIRYDGNGATEGNVTGTTVTVADGGTIADNDYKRFGYEFAGWNTAADGTGTMYTPGEHVDAGEVLASGFVLRLYAQWNELFANITYTTGRWRRGPARHRRRQGLQHHPDRLLGHRYPQGYRRRGHSGRHRRGRSRLPLRFLGHQRRHRRDL